jgi:hypothetical protein
LMAGNDVRCNVIVRQQRCHSVCVAWISGFLFLTKVEGFSYTGACEVTGGWPFVTFMINIRENINIYEVSLFWPLSMLIHSRLCPFAPAIACLLCPGQVLLFNLDEPHWPTTPYHLFIVTSRCVICYTCAPRLCRSPRNTHNQSLTENCITWYQVTDNMRLNR